MAYDLYTQGADPVMHARLAELLVSDNDPDDDLEELGYGGLVKVSDDEAQAVLERVFSGGGEPT